MNDRAKQIQEIATIMEFCCNVYDDKGNRIRNKCNTYDCEYYCDTNLVCCSYSIKEATALYNAGYRKIPEGSVVLSKEEYEALILIEQYHIKSCGKNSVVLTTEELEEARKEIAKELLSDIGNALHDLAIQYSDMGLLSHFTVCDYVRRVLVRKVAKQYGVEIKE